MRRSFANKVSQAAVLRERVQAGEEGPVVQEDQAFIRVGRDRARKVKARLAPKVLKE